jgi:hypothetical protein
MKKISGLIVLIIVFAAFANAQASTDIKKIDFTNFTFQIQKSSVKMKDGLQEKACQEKDADGIATGDVWNVSAESIAYGDLDGDGKTEAIVPMVANICGGNMLTDEAVLVYTVKAGKISQLPTFEYYDEGCVAGEKGCNFARTPGVNVSYDAKEKAIIVENSFSTDDDAICCPSLYRQTWYQWNGAKFVELKKGKIIKREETE